MNEKEFGDMVCGFGMEFSVVIAAIIVMFLMCVGTVKFCDIVWHRAFPGNTQTETTSEVTK